MGETGRLLKTRLEEHKKDVDNAPEQQYTRNFRKQSVSSINKSAIIDHANTENHIIDWEGVSIVDRESQKKRRHVKESIWIRKTTGAFNRDEGNYDLSRAWDVVIPAESVVLKKPSCQDGESLH